MATIEIHVAEFGVQVNIRTATVEEAREIATKFPKTAKFYAGDVSHGGGVETGLVRASITLQSNDVNGGANETGMKRLRSIRKNAEKLGFTEEITGDRKSVV